MAHIFANGILETSTTAGTGALTLAGAVNGYRRFSDKCAIGDTVHYRIEAVDSQGVPTGPYELGRGTYSAANVLTRTTPIESSNANAAVSFSGDLRVSITVLSPNTSAQVLADWQELMVAGVNGGSGAHSGMFRIDRPAGASHADGNSSVTGALKIRLPVSWTNSMLRFNVKIYNYSGGNGGGVDRSFTVGGYNYDGGGGAASWVNTFVDQQGTGNDINVHFGHDGTYCCVWIGDTTTVWNYPQVAITDVEVGYSAASQTSAWLKNWELSFVTSITTAGHTVRALMAYRRVAAGMYLNNSDASLEIKNLGGSGDGNCAHMRFWTDGTYGIKMGLRADGYFGIGGWSRNAWSWYTAPNGDMTAAGNVISYSDPRLKEDFQRFKDPLSLIRQLDGGSFRWKQGFEHTLVKAGKSDYGVLADQVEKVLPYAVSYSIEIAGEKYQAVAYEKIVPLLIEAVKALEDQVKELKKELENKK